MSAVDPSDSYALGRSTAETRRLMRQAQIYGPITRQFLASAGIGTSMKVLDVGSGAGDVALLLADLVGPRGRVVGVEMNPVILETARARVDAVGWTTISMLWLAAGS
jgi:ubiquinone/menaquinone biosynthesis C-methylase UbiE